MLWGSAITHKSLTTSSFLLRSAGRAVLRARGGHQHLRPQLHRPRASKLHLHLLYMEEPYQAAGRCSGESLKSMARRERWKWLVLQEGSVYVEGKTAPPAAVAAQLFLLTFILSVLLMEELNSRVFFLSLISFTCTFIYSPTLLIPASIIHPIYHDCQYISPNTLDNVTLFSDQEIQYGIFYFSP